MHSRGGRTCTACSGEEVVLCCALQVSPPSEVLITLPPEPTTQPTSSPAKLRASEHTEAYVVPFL